MQLKAAARNGKDELRRLVEGAGRIVAFTGAGISTESGIPDFRSPGGLWTRFKPVDFETFLSSPAMRREALTRYLSLRREVGPVRPSRGHRALASLARTGRLSHVVTQNIDNLHQDSGLADEQVIELHGNGTYARCLECGTRHELDWIQAALDASDGAPACTACGGIVKTATISFGQPMPQHEMARAEEATLGCDLFLTIGSSLQVYPAAAFPLVAKRNGSLLVIINREPTELDRYADLVVHDDIGDVLEPFIV